MEAIFRELTIRNRERLEAFAREQEGKLLPPAPDEPED
jgi:hypothetical protein